VHKIMVVGPPQGGVEKSLNSVILKITRQNSRSINITENCWNVYKLYIRFQSHISDDVTWGKWGNTPGVEKNIYGDGVHCAVLSGTGICSSHVCLLHSVSQLVLITYVLMLCTR